MFSQIGSGLAKGACLGCLVLFLIACIWAVYDVTAYRKLQLVATDVANGASATSWSQETADMVEQTLSQLPASCRWVDLKAEQILNLALLDRLIASKAPYEERLSAFSRNIAFAKNATRCGPIRHKNWVNLARLESVASFNMERQDKLLRFSRILAPTQLANLLDRLTIYGLMPGAGYLVTMEPVQKDFLSAMRYGRRKTLVNVLKSLQSRGIDLSQIFEQAHQSEIDWLKARGVS